MEKQKKKEKILQWHPALYAGLQIEFKDEAEKLNFENEHQLGTKPMEIDILIIKKDDDSQIRKNIGRIYRKHNIIEYKSPDDNLSVDDFYKVYGYVYKADAVRINSIKIEDITVSYISYHYPRELISHLENVLHYTVKRVEVGIYYVYGAMFPIQIIVTRQLNEYENLWLKSLTKKLEKTETAEKLLKEYGKNKKNKLYESVMNIIVNANKEKFEEDKAMCEALRELMKDELEARERAGEERGEKHGQEIGEIRGKEKVNELTVRLADCGRMDDIVKAAKDKEYQKQLLEEFGL